MCSTWSLLLVHVFGAMHFSFKHIVWWVVRTAQCFVSGVRLWGPGLCLNVCLSSPTPPATHLLLLTSSSLSSKSHCRNHYHKHQHCHGPKVRTFIIIIIPTMVIKYIEKPAIVMQNSSAMLLLIPGSCYA